MFSFLFFSTLKPVASSAWILQELSLNPSPSHCPPAHLQGEINSPSSWPPKLKLFQEGNKNIFDIKNKPTCIPNTQTCINYAVPWPGLVSSSRSRNNKNWTTARKSMLPQPSIYFQLVSPNPQSACHFMPDPFILNWRSLFTRQASKAVAANDLLFLTIFTEFISICYTFQICWTVHSYTLKSWQVEQAAVEPHVVMLNAAEFQSNVS